MTNKIKNTLKFILSFFLATAIISAPVIATTTHKADAFYVGTDSYAVETTIARKRFQGFSAYSYTENKSWAWVYYFRNSTTFWRGTSKAFIDASINHLRRIPISITHKISPKSGGIGAIYFNATLGTSGPGISVSTTGINDSGTDTTSTNNRSALTHYYSYSASIWKPLFPYIHTTSKFQYNEFSITVDSWTDKIDNTPSIIELAKKAW